jgi:hypothetical protein
MLWLFHQLFLFASSLPAFIVHGIEKPFSRLLLYSTPFSVIVHNFVCPCISSLSSRLNRFVLLALSCLFSCVAFRKHDSFQCKINSGCLSFACVFCRMSTNHCLAEVRNAHLTSAYFASSQILQSRRPVGCIDGHFRKQGRPAANV